MGFLKQDAPVVDYAEWSKGTRAERIVPMARHWAEVGFGTPVALHVRYGHTWLRHRLGPAGHRRMNGLVKEARDRWDACSPRSVSTNMRSRRRSTW